MSRVAAIFAMAAMIAAPLFAAVELSDLDGDGNGVVSFDELVLMYPDVTDEVYTMIDSNTDGSVDDVELMAAFDGGLLMEKAE